MAMKEIAIQPGETKAIRNVAEELKIFEGISHKNLVKVYGVEIHRVSELKKSFTISCNRFSHDINEIPTFAINRRSYLFSWSCVRRER